MPKSYLICLILINVNLNKKKTLINRLITLISLIESREDLDKFYHNNSNANLNSSQIQNTSDLNQMRKSISLNNLTQPDYNSTSLTQAKNFSTTNINDINQIQEQRFSLMDKKKQKWNQDAKDAPEEHWPYGKPGAGAGPKSNNDSSNNASLPPAPPSHDPKSRKQKDAIDEYNRINQQLKAIMEAESKIKQEQLVVKQNANANAQVNAYHDQSRVPAAMRTSLQFGDVMFDEDIKKTKELERKKWLLELEEQKREKLVESQRFLNNQAANPIDISPRELKHQRVSAMSHQQPDFTQMPSLQISANANLNPDDEKNYGRTRKLLDPAQIDELERKRKAGLQHKREIDAQIAEKKRMQTLEEEIQTLNDLKTDNEARQISTFNQQFEETKQKQPQYQNFDKALGNLNSVRVSDAAKKDTMASILQGDQNNFANDHNSSRSNVSETRAQEIYRKMQEAELSAAEEKHRRLLKRLQRGGHDTKQLEKKFAELKARLTGNPTGLYNYNTVNTQQTQPPSIYTTRNESKMGMAEILNPELNLERQKQMLEKKLLNQNDIGGNKENYELNTDQKSTLKHIFQLLREDTSGLPAELTEDQLERLLKKVKHEDSVASKKANAQKPKTQPKSNESKKKPVQPVKLGPNGKPIWNYKNMEGKTAVPNSQKDPFYNERAKFVEERRRRQLEHQQGLVEKTNEKYNEFMSRQHKNSELNEDSFSNDSSSMSRGGNRGNRDEVGRRQSTSSSMSNTSTYTSNNDYRSGNKPQQGESILNLLNKNLANNTIYEEDEDQFAANPNMNRYTHRGNAGGGHLVPQQSNRQVSEPQKTNKNSNSNNSSLDEAAFGQNGFVPFMRTNEFLDPKHAGSPVPPSRESSAVKRDREKARQVYFFIFIMCFC